MILDTPASWFSPFHPLQPHSFCEGSPEGQATLLRCLSKIHVDDTWRAKVAMVEICGGGNMGKHGERSFEEKMVAQSSSRLASFGHSKNGILFLQLV